jgi:LmbE family N-acetylglucosaminyl deacetylase
LEAAKIAGAAEVIFLREPDGMLQATLELRKKLVREIRRFRPEVVVCGDPTIVWAGNDYINHPDHRAAATAALDATFPAAGQPNLFEELEQEGIMAHKPRKVYVTTWDVADVWVNIDETIDVKIAALRAHKSQMKEWDPEESIKQWAAERAKGKEMTYAEGFRVVTLVDDKTWENIKEKH